MESDIRKRKENEETWQISQFVDDVFKEIYIQFKDYFNKKYNSVNDNPLLKKIKEYISLMDDIKSDLNNKKKYCDEIFFDYLKDISCRSNKEYFYFAFKFIVLLREGINKLKKQSNDVDISKEFTEVINAEQIPDFCNEFIGEFMELYNYFNLSNEQKEELIEIIQHFCFWLFDNGYTSSRLSIMAG